jgi:hypothetical protein
MKNFDAEARLCTTCGHSKTGEFIAVLKCYHPLIVSKVTGNPVFCSIERNCAFDTISKCGLSGKLWEPKEQ